MSALTPSFPPAIRRYLGAFVARGRRVRVVRAGVVALAFVLAWTVVVALADRLAPMPPWLRALLLAGECGGVAAILAAPVRAALRRRVDWVEAAAQAEHRDGSLGQRLVTVTSQLLAPADYRGSPQMLDVLAREVSGEVANKPAGGWGDWRVVARPAFAAGCLMLATAGLWGVEWLMLPRLVARQVRPLASIPPVTTTQVRVTPEGADVREHQPLEIRAAVRRLTKGPRPTIHVGLAGGKQRWDASPMSPVAEGTYAFTLSDVDQDQRFYIEAGDATTPVYDVRVLRQPAVAEFRVRYTYPAYTGRGPLSVHNTDGLIEAPRGSQAVIGVVATEPLASAALNVGGRRIELAATAEPNVRQVTLTVNKDEPCELEMVSRRGVTGGGPKGMRVRAAPDRAPLVRLAQPAMDLRLSPRDTVPVAYQALDDYGVAQLSVRAQVNGNPPVDYPRRVKGDARRTEGTSEIDLVALGAKVGDVVSVTVVAADRAGQKGTSDVRHVLVSPRSIDMTTHQRLAELSQAAVYAAEWARQLAAARDSLDRAAKVDVARADDRAAALAGTARRLGAAVEVGASLRQSLLRAIVYSAGAKMSDALALGVDAAAAQADGVERVDEALALRPDALDAAVARLGRAADGARQLAEQVKQFADGDQAAAVLAERVNLGQAPGSTAPVDPAARERRKQTLDRANQDVAAALAGLGIDPKAGDVDAQLQRRIDAANRLIDAARLPDYVSLARRWATAIRTNEPQPPHLDERLLAASQAEAVRPDPGLVAARDLQLAARAAAAIAALRDGAGGGGVEGASGGEDPAEVAIRERTLREALDQFPDALGALRAGHDVQRRIQRAAAPADRRKIHDAAAAVLDAAAAARAKVVSWGAGPGATADELAAQAREAEELAMAANAATESKQFDEAAKLDRQLAGATGRPELADAAAGPRQIDRLSNAQGSLADRTAAAGDDREAASFAGAQRDVAEEIGRTPIDPWEITTTGGGTPPTPATPDSAEARQKATAAISEAQEKLASVPMQLTNAQQLALGVAEVAQRVAQAQGAAAEAAPARRESTQRVLGMVRDELVEARQSYEAALKPFDYRAVDELADALRPFTPDTSLALTTIEESLKESLADLRGALVRAAETGDRAGVEVAAQRVRDAVANAQEALRDAQARVIERDPLVSARWFARAAADALATAPPNKPTAVAHQRKTLEALNKAAADAMRRSKTARLSQVPSYVPFYVPAVPGVWGDADGRFSGDRFMETLPGLREWGRFRDRAGEPLDAPIRESEPAGYGDALRTYFEVLGREDSAKPAEGK